MPGLLDFNGRPFVGANGSFGGFFFPYDDMISPFAEPVTLAIPDEDTLAVEGVGSGAGLFGLEPFNTPLTDLDVNGAGPIDVDWLPVDDGGGLFGLGLGVSALPPVFDWSFLPWNAPVEDPGLNGAGDSLFGL